MVFTMFWVIACCDINFDLLTPKANQHIYESVYICDQDWVNMVFKGFWLIACCDLDLGPFDPKIQSAHLWIQTYQRPELGEISFIGF